MSGTRMGLDARIEHDTQTPIEHPCVKDVWVTRHITSSAATRPYLLTPGRPRRHRPGSRTEAPLRRRRRCSCRARHDMLHIRCHGYPHSRRCRGVSRPCGDAAAERGHPHRLPRSLAHSFVSVLFFPFSLCFRAAASQKRRTS